LGIPTAGSLSTFQHCLISYAENIEKCGHNCDIAVMDDSPASTKPSPTLDWLRSFARKYPRRIYYAGPSEKAEYVLQLSKVGIPPQLCEFVLSNPLNIRSSPGANRNALLLQTCGRVFLSCDDDSVFAAEDLRSGAQHTDWLTKWNPFDEIGFPALDEATSGSLTIPTIDLIDAHQGLLGHPISELARRVSDFKKSNTVGVRGRVVSDILEGRGRALVTMSGIRGDPGLPDLSDLMTLTGEARRRFLLAREKFGSDVVRDIFLGVRRPTLATSLSTLFTTTATGFDNTILLPPFIPSGRGEDTFFGCLLGRIFSDCYLGYIPVALKHAPNVNRQFRSLPCAPSLSNVLTIVLHGCPDPPTVSTRDRLTSIGRYFIECGSAAPYDFEMHICRVIRRWMIDRIEKCEHLLSIYNDDRSEWVKEMKEWTARLKASISARVVCVPIDVGDLTHSIDSRLACVQRFVRQFGEVLSTWPEIALAVHKLSEGGCNIGQLVERG
jgi:hypothetical protein